MMLRPKNSIIQEGLDNGYYNISNENFINI